MEMYSGDTLNYFKLSELTGKRGCLEVTEDTDCTFVAFHCEDGNVYVIDIKYKDAKK